jgi:membrane-associated protease RseP (regulator of RpoE activity)
VWLPPWWLEHAEYRHAVDNLIHMLGGFAAAVAIIFFVTAHEAGHFFAAKATGMKATEFFFGFGPRLWSTQRGETEYGLKALPLGGYVRIIGMNPLEEVSPEDLGRTYREKKFWEKSVVVLAGVGTNFLIAFILFYGLVMANGVPGDLIPVVGAVVEDSPAEVAGLQVNDRIVAIDGDPITGMGGGPGQVRRDRPGTGNSDRSSEGRPLQRRGGPGESEMVAGAGFLGVTPLRDRRTSR